MTFGSPAFFWLMLLVPLCIAASIWFLVWRARARRTFGGIADEPAPAKAALFLTPLLLIAAIALAVFAAARPQFGESTDALEQRGIDVVIVLDTSNSMTATDAPPNRLGLAQMEISAFLARSRGDRVGLVLFAAQPFLRSPLTSDLVALAGVVSGVDEERALLDPGSDLGSAINRAAAMLDESTTETRVILVVSDGEDFGTAAESAVASAARDGIRVYTAGVGTAEGSPVLDLDARTGVVTARVDPETGQPVLTRLDSTSLRLLAESGGGRFLTLGGEGSLAELAGEFAGLETTSFGEEDATNPVERFQVFAALALLLADVELMLLAIPRRKGVRASTAARLWPVAGAAMFIAAVCGTTVADVNNAANAQYQQGQYAAALDAYRTAQALDGDDKPELYYNAGNALNMLARYEEAIEETLRARACRVANDPCDPATLARIEYALGNHYAGANRLRDALEAYRRALLAESDDNDAKANYELASRWLTPTPDATQSAPVGTPTAGGEEGEPGSGAEDPGAEASPGAGEGGTPEDAGGEQEPLPEDPAELTEEQLQQALDEALAGIDEEFTPEEAQRLLELLAEENRRGIESAAEDIIRPDLPDY